MYNSFTSAIVYVVLINFRACSARRPSDKLRFSLFSGIEYASLITKKKPLIVDSAIFHKSTIKNVAKS